MSNYRRSAPSHVSYFAALVTAICVCVFCLIIRNYPGEFVLNGEYQVIPADFVLPKGCDIRVDLQSGETWARLSAGTRDSSSSLIKTSDPEHENAVDAQAPEYKNLTKSRITGRLSGELKAKIRVALDSLDSEESWTFLEDEAPAIEFGLGLVEAANFGNFRKFLSLGDERALQVLAVSLQNNPLAVERVEQLNLFEEDFAPLLSSEISLSGTSFKRLLRCLENLLLFGNGNLKNFIVKQHQGHLLKLALEHNVMQEQRYKEILEALLPNEQ